MISYALITPTRNDAENLVRLADAIAAQSVLPEAWLIVDNGSDDDTVDIGRRLEGDHDWIQLVTIPGESSPTRGAPIVRAFTAGVAELGALPDVVAKLDADVSFNSNHFEQLLAEFVGDRSLGIAGSVCYERENGEWKPRRVARSHVRGAVRAYRRDCLLDVMPLEERFGWDGIDELKAQLRGWSTRTIEDIQFFHHRATGQRDGARRSWVAQGALAWFLGYRLPYLLIRTLYRSTREPQALAMLYGWAKAALSREPRYDDLDVRRLLRSQQTLSALPLRMREATGRAGAVRN